MTDPANDVAGGCTRRALLGSGALTAAALATPVSFGLLADGALAAAPAADDQVVVWRGLDEWRAEVASVHLTNHGIAASGTQVGFDPLVYRVDYRLEAKHDFITRRLVLDATGSGWRRHLDLRHDGHGNWTISAHSHGTVDLPAPGGDTAPLRGAVDCDLGLCPLTNLMPIRRSGLDRHAGAQDFLMAWVSVPDLSVHASGQRYEHVRVTPTGSVVRYVDRGLFPGFKADLKLDRDGIVELYPGLARREHAPHKA